MTDSVTLPEERIRIFNRAGNALAEFRASIKRSWAMGEEGRAEFVYPARETDVVNERVLQFGNWLLVENTLLPPWVGVLDTPRKWGGRNVTVSAYTPEHVFGWRIGPLEQVVNQTAGQIFDGLILRINRAEATILQRGLIWRGGSKMEMTLNPKPLNDTLKDLRERSDHEYAWRPIIDTLGRLSVRCDWKAQVGSVTQALLQAGAGGGNLEDVSNLLVEDGPIVNSILAYGDGETWQTKPTATFADPGSKGTYGLRQAAEEYSGVTNTTTLQTYAKDKIKNFKQPARRLEVNALNVSKTFNYLRIGNQLIVSLENAGLRKRVQGTRIKVRILGMVYDPRERNRVELVVEEVL